MVAAAYVRLERTARRLIEKYGKDAAIERLVKVGPAHNPVLSEESYACRLVDLGYSLTNRDMSIVVQGDKLGLISTAISSAPESVDKILIDGHRYSFIDLQPLNPGGLTLLYEFHARR